MRRSRLLLGALVMLVAAAIVGGIWPDPIGALSGADVVYAIKLKNGVSKTAFGDAFKFTGKGTMTVNDTTGEFSYSLDLSNGLTFAGTGNLVESVNKQVYATATSVSGGVEGHVIFTGKMKAGGKKFAGGKMYVALPNRLGAPPDGFVYTTGKLSGTRQ